MSLTTNLLSNKTTNENLNLRNKVMSFSLKPEKKKKFNHHKEFCVLKTSKFNNKTL